MRESKIGRFTSFFKFCGVHVKSDPGDETKSWCMIKDQMILITPVDEKIICDISEVKKEDVEQLIGKFGEWNYHQKQMRSPFKTAEELKAAIKESLTKSL